MRIPFRAGSKNQKSSLSSNLPLLFPLFSGLRRYISPSVSVAVWWATPLQAFTQTDATLAVWTEDITHIPCCVVSQMPLLY